MKHARRDHRNLFARRTTSVKRPYVIAEGRFHRRSDPQCLLDSGEIVTHEVNSNHVPVMEAGLTNHVWSIAELLARTKIAVP